LQYILLFKGDCTACSGVAEMVNDLAVGNLEARPASTPKIMTMLGDAGLASPTGPALLIVADGSVRMVSGWEMRRTLGSLIGWRKARTIARLAAAEWRARRSTATASTPTASTAAASTATKAGGFSRRGVVGAGFAGIIGAAIPWSTAAAATRSVRQEPALVKADEADVREAVKLDSVRRAVRTFGALSPAAYAVNSGQTKTLVLVHGRGEIVTLVDTTAGVAAKSTVLSMGIAPTEEVGIRFYSVDGFGLADLTRQGAKAVEDQRPDVVEAPDISKAELICFIGCVGETVSVTCAVACLGCIEGGIPAIWNCPYCLACAGPEAVKCAKRCF
jgi:hypothetical protein